MISTFIFNCQFKPLSLMYFPVFDSVAFSTTKMRRHMKEHKEHVVYQKLGSKDLPSLKTLIEVYEEAFEMENFTMPGDAYLQTLLDREGLVFYVATAERQVIGGLTAHILPSVYFESAEVYIFDLGVKVAFQRRGIGKALIAALSDFCKEQRYREIFVQADMEDQHAMDFYQAIGGLPERVVHYTYPISQ